VLNPSDTITEGYEVLLYIDHMRRWIKKVKRGSIFGSDRGSLKYDDIIGKKYGDKAVLSLGYDVYLLRPLLIDYIERGFERKTQIIYPKDLGFIVLLSGIGPGARVLEAGVGSGILTAVLANIVRPTGKVYGYEIRKEFAEITMRNLRRLGLEKYAEIRIGDVKQGIDVKGLDAAFLDLPDPWNALEKVYEALKPSAPIIAFLPTINQVEKMLSAIKEDQRFVDSRCYEILLREYQLVEGAIRPKTHMIGHTGYIFFARKVLRPAP